MSLASAACTCARTACAGRGSILNSSCPALTSSPSFTALCNSWPSTSDLTATLLIASTVPTAVTSSGIVFFTAAAVLTGTAGSAGGGGADEQPATNAATASSE